LAAVAVVVLAVTGALAVSPESRQLDATG